MTPFYFGHGARRLFGVFHPPDAGTALRAGVVLAPPFGQEAIRVHRFYRLLADRLARHGIAVLRFDFYGTGDSGGEDDDADLDAWAGDLAQAHRELLRRIGDRRVTWFAARLAAPVALRAVPLSFPRVHKLVLWDPVFDGMAYLTQLGAAQLDELEHAYCIPDAQWRRDFERDPLALSGECFGFALPERLRAQIQALTPQQPASAPGSVVSVVAAEGDAGARAWCEAVQAAYPGAMLRHSAFDHSLIWLSNAFPNNEMAPAPALQKMAAELE